jgi:hypothetical protein
MILQFVLAVRWRIERLRKIWLHGGMINEQTDQRLMVVEKMLVYSMRI